VKEKIKPPTRRLKLLRRFVTYLYKKLSDEEAERFLLGVLRKVDRKFTTGEKTKLADYIIERKFKRYSPVVIENLKLTKKVIRLESCLFVNTVFENCIIEGTGKLDIEGLASITIKDCNFTVASNGLYLSPNARIDEIEQAFKETRVAEKKESSK
jgi:hypothetical protein